MRRISHLHTKTKGDCSEMRSSGDNETSDEAGVCEISVHAFRYLSHVRIWAKYFQTVLPLSFDLLWEYRALVYFLELALILCWLVDLILYALRQLFVITQSLFKPPLLLLLSFASQFWAVKNIIPFVSVTNHIISL